MLSQFQRVLNAIEHECTFKNDRAIDDQGHEYRDEEGCVVLTDEVKEMCKKQKIKVPISE